MRRRLLLPVVLLFVVMMLLVGAAAWILRPRAGLPGTRSTIDRPAPPGTETRETLTDTAPEGALRGTARREPREGAKASPPLQDESWTLTFETVDADGSPVDWRWAQIHDAEGTILQEIFPKDDPLPAGTVEITGTGTLVVEAHHRVLWASGWLTPPPSGTRHLVVHFERGSSVAGRVFEQDGVTPLRHGTVSAWTPRQDEPYRPPTVQEGLVGADGRFSIPGLPPGPVHLQAKAGDWAKGQKVRADVQTGDENVRLVLGPQGAIAFLIVDEATGLSPRTAQCNVYTLTDGKEQPWSLTSGPLRPGPQPAAWPTGWCRAVPGRTYRFRVEARGYEPSDIVEVDVPETGGKQIVQIALRADATSVARVTIALHTNDGDLPSWLPVTRYLGLGSSTTPTKVEDERILLDLMPGLHRISVGGALAPKPEDPDTFWIPVDLSLDLKHGEQRTVDVWLERGGYVVIVGHPDPRPREVRLRRGDEVVLRRAHSGFWGKKIETGYVLGVLPPGTWTLEYAERGKGRRATFTVEREKVTRLDPETFEAFQVEAK